jgi:hypothetical protein
MKQKKMMHQRRRDREPENRGREVRDGVTQRRRRERESQNKWEGEGGRMRRTKSA